MMNCEFGLVSKIGVWLFAKQYNEPPSICNKIGGIRAPIVDEDVDSVVIAPIDERADKSLIFIGKNGDLPGPLLLVI
jgi:hypothetical protein